jgi:ATP-dependent helicase/nuclease subunit A
MSASGSSLIAADPHRSAWVAANAGAGKTYTLANRVTRLLLAETPPEKILCLTYTKAAAAEMQGRLFKQLGEWSMLPDEALAGRIAEIGAEPGGAEQLRQARRLFAQALETPGGLKILTIHAFCQSVLSRFPLEAGVPAPFDVLDDRTARELMAEARTRVLERTGRGDAERAAALAYLLTHTSETTLSAILDTALGGDRRKLERFLEELGGRDLDHAIRRAHGAGDRTPDEVVTDFCLALRIDELGAVAAWMAQGSKKDQDQAAALASALALEPGPAMWEAVKAVALTKEGEPRKDPVTKKHSATHPDLRAVVDRLQDDVLAVEEERRAAHAAMLARAALTLIAAMRDEYAAAKRLRGALDYDDLVARTLALLERGDAAAWVLYKLDGGVDHLLIDEAQDTSPEQWRIVKALTAEFFTDPRHTVFAVGDEKQSIFSFQGAEPREFDRHRAFFAEAARTASHPFVIAPLTQSRRSVPEVLQFVDAVFANPDARAGLTSDDAPIHHEAFRAQARGRVELRATVKPDGGAEQDPWQTPVNVVPRSSPAAQLARRVARDIDSWVGRVTLPGHTERVKAGDIMILLPRREPFGTAVIRELKQLGVPVAGADRIRLTEQIAVMDLIALGRFALLPEDDYTLAVVLRSPLCGASEEQLYALGHGREGSLWRALQRRRDEFADLHEFLADVHRRADRTPPFEFYTRLLDAAGMRLKLLARLGHEANDAIDEFLSLAFAHEGANTPSLEGFLHWIARGGAEIKRDMERGRDEVRVMTVHGAKGLEADIVVLPDTTGVPRLAADQGNLLYTEEGVLYPMAEKDAPAAVKAAKLAAKARMLEEHRRLLYVALTRARDRLYICGFEGKAGLKPDSWYALAQAAATQVGREIVRDGEAVHVLGDDEAEADIAPAPSQAPPARPRKRWVTAPARPEAAAPRLIRPSEASDAEELASAPLSGAGAARYRRGLLVHALLARLPDLPPDARRAAALRYLERRAEPDDAEALAEETLRILDDPAFAAAFAPGSRAEAGIVADLPELGPAARVNGRIDRLAVSADSVLIVDYKTNRPPPAREEDVHAVHQAQMALYRAAAAKIFPGRRIACALVWTETPSLMPLSDALLDAALARLAARLAGP